MIPVYQRNYSWNKENCEQLFEDLLHVEEEGKNHYFGNIVYYVSRNDTIHNYEELALIDGQQRITTVMLLIAAIRDNCEDESERASITKNYLQNRDSEERERVKLKQIEGDRDSYEAIIAGREPENKECNAWRNYLYFKKAVELCGKSPAELLEALNRLIIVAIDLKLKEAGSLSEKPQIIFESINATGRKLSDADLLRNFLLLDISDEEQEYYYKEYWLPIERNIPTSDDMTNYINRYLIMRLKDDVQRNTEYKTFKRYYKELFNTEANNRAQMALADLLHFSKYYGWIKNPASTGDKELSLALDDINDARSDYAAPLFLLLAERSENPNYPNYTKRDFIESLNAIESWLFRARIVKDITTGMIGQIARDALLSAVLRADKNANYTPIIVEELSNYRTRDIWPKDEQFKEAFAKYDFYHNYKNYVQRKLERVISKDHDDINIDPHSIEHVMPQTLTNDWKIELGDDYARLHAEYLNTIGNLAPMNKSDNSINSNDDFDKKKAQLRNSAWKLTQGIAEYGKWGIKEIEARGESLAIIAANIWRGPIERTREIEANTQDSDGRDIGLVPVGTILILDEPGSNTKAKVEIIKKENGKTGYKLLAGAKINATIKEHLAWRRDGFKRKLVKDDDSLILEEDIIFDTPSAAAVFCVGRNYNGWTGLHNEAGVSLDKLARGDS